MPSSKMPLYLKSHANDEGMTATRVVAYVGFLKKDGEGHPLKAGHLRHSVFLVIPTKEESRLHRPREIPPSSE